VTGCDRSIVYIRSRAAVHVEPRHIFFHLAYTSLGKVPLRVIGQYAGGRDHSTVIHGSDNIAGLSQYDKRLADLLGRIKDHLVGRLPANEDPELRVKLFEPYLGFIAGG
jgi:hypothetical protein